jgi:hypothetical protein
VFPGVLAVEDDADQRGFPGGGFVADARELIDKMLRGVAAVPFGVFEADQIGEFFIAEKHGDARRGLDSPGVVKKRGCRFDVAEAQAVGEDALA